MYLQYRKISSQQARRQTSIRRLFVQPDLGQKRLLTLHIKHNDILHSATNFHRRCSSTDAKSCHLTPTSNGYNYLYSSYSEDEPVFEEMVDSNSIIKPINTHTVVPPKLTLVSTPPKELKKQRKNRGRTRLTTIKRSQSDKTASSRFLSTALHSVSQAITRANSHRIAMYIKNDTACCADSGASEEMLPDYSTFKTCNCLTNRYATLGNTTKLPIE